MARIDSFLRLVAEQHASDLHFHAGNPPIIRHNGDLVHLPFRTLSDEEARRFLFEMLTPLQREHFEREFELDFAYDLEGVARFRANMFIQNHGIGAVFRIIPNHIPTLDELGLPSTVRRLSTFANGLVLVTGPTGSGKSTTLAAMIQEVNNTSRRHVISIEDPIEFVHKPKDSVITQRQVGAHTESFNAALRSSLRESPDVLVVGEMRDYETVSLALAAAETGVLVLGTLHTNSAAKAIDRMIDVCPDDVQDQVRGLISVVLRGVVAQVLAKRASGEGRVAVNEVLLVNTAVANMIRENKVFQLDAYLQAGELASAGMQGLDTCLFNLVRTGVIEPDEGLRLANNPDHLRKQLSELGEDN